ncbi:MAG: DUF3253 domain-containing protein [Proteobacteria bacterium]|nr:DUF3253 domain-containing protein [Pseudomonadota bacterium]
MSEQSDASKETEKPDDPMAVAIMALLNDGLKPTFRDVAQFFAKERAKPKDGPDLWRRYMNAAKQEAIHLARGGRVQIIRKGQVADPNDFKGIVRLRLPE